MSDERSQTASIDKPFQPLARWQTSRAGETYAQTLPAEQTGDYLIVQRDDAGVHIETRERFRKNGRGRMRNRRLAHVTLTDHDAEELGSILQAPDDLAPVQALQTRVNEAEAGAAQARADLEQARQDQADADNRARQREEQSAEAEQRAEAAERGLGAEQSRRQNAAGTAGRLRRKIDKLEQQLAASEQRAQVAESRLAELVWLRDRVNRLRPLIDRLPASLRQRLRRFVPTVTASEAPEKDAPQAPSSIDDLPLPFDESADTTGVDEATVHSTAQPETIARQATDSSGDDMTASEDAGTRFVTWLKASIEDETLPINTKNRAAIQVLPDGMLIVSPSIFKTFDPKNWRHVQRRFQKLRLHTRNPRGENIWTGYLDRGKRERWVKGLLISDAESVLGVTLPDPNPHLILIDAADETPCA